MAKTAKDKKATPHVETPTDGVPSIVMAAGRRAFSFLVGADTDLTTLGTSKLSQDAKMLGATVRDLSQAIAGLTADLAAEDRYFMGRAVEAVLNRSCRAQRNKDAIVAMALENLIAIPPETLQRGPSEDWLALFERYAEDISDPYRGRLLAMLLAGEIRESGRVSAATLDFVSELDADTAEFILRLLPYCLASGVALIDCVSPELDDDDINTLRDNGFWKAQRPYKIELDKNGTNLVLFKNATHGVALRGVPGTKIALNTIGLSRAGTQLVEVAGTPFDYHAFANLALRQKGIQRALQGLIKEEKGKISFVAPKELEPLKVLTSDI